MSKWLDQTDFVTLLTVSSENKDLNGKDLFLTENGKTLYWMITEGHREGRKELFIRSDQKAKVDPNTNF